MGERYVQKLAYSFDFQSEDLRPLVETQTLLEKDDVLATFGNKDLGESIQKETKGEDVGLAEIQDDVSDMNTSSLSTTQASGDKDQEQVQDKKYALTYFNPATGKAEVLAVASNIKIRDYTKKMIEEAVGMKSTYPIYSFVATPLIQTEVNPYVLQEIKDNREYMTPPKFGGAVVIRPQPRQSHLVVVDSKEAVAEAMHRRETTERKLSEEIVVIEKAVEDIKAHKDAEKVVEHLPALSRARFAAALKKKHISSSTLLILLQRDVSFLKDVKKKLGNLSLPELLDLARAIKKLKEK